MPLGAFGPNFSFMISGTLGVGSRLRVPKDFQSNVNSLKNFLDLKLALIKYLIVGMGLHSEHSLTLKRQYEPRRFGPGIFAFFCYIIPTILLIWSIYMCFIGPEVKFDQEGYSMNWFSILFFVQSCLLLCGRLYGIKYDSVKLKDGSHRQASCEAMNHKFEAWTKGYDPAVCLSKWTIKLQKQHLQHEKERFAMYLSRSCSRIQAFLYPSVLVPGTTLYLMMGFQIAVLVGFWNVCAIQFEGDYTRILQTPPFWLMLPALPVSFMVTRRLEWYDSLEVAARKIRRECQAVDTEKGGTPREQLAWWIENILKEDSDSDALARERMEVVITPIIERIHCYLNRESLTTVAPVLD